MKLKSSYKFISLFMSIIMLAGIIMPSVFSTMHCDMMMDRSETTDNTHVEMVKLNSDSDQIHTIMDKMDFNNTNQFVDCDCSLMSNSISVEELAFLKTVTPKLHVKSTLLETLLTSDQKSPPPISYSNSYIPPTLFLANESLLI